MEKIKLLYSEDGTVRDINGRFIFSAPLTERAVELNENDGWDKENESWLSYRNRTSKERVQESIKRVEFAKDLVMAYNEIHKLT